MIRCVVLLAMAPLFSCRIIPAQIWRRQVGSGPRTSNEDELVMSHSLLINPERGDYSLLYIAYIAYLCFNNKFRQ